MHSCHISARFVCLEAVDGVSASVLPTAWVCRLFDSAAYAAAYAAAYWLPTISHVYSLLSEHFNSSDFTPHMTACALL